MKRFGSTGTDVDTSEDVLIPSKEIDAEIPPSKLLALPPELRNRIYEYCLKTEYLLDTDRDIDLWSGCHIEVTEELKPPALLSTCRQVRDQASKIWWLSNTIFVKIEDYDATLFFAWEKLARGLKEHWGGKPTGTICVTQEPNWTNLLQWCYALWSGKVLFVDDGTLNWNGKGRVLLTAQTIAEGSQGLPWEKCEKTLESFRAAAGDVDEEWLH